MATGTTTKLMTAEEFMTAELGEGTFELVRGEVVKTPPPMPKHGLVCGNRPDDELPLVLQQDQMIENLPELPGFRCAVADFFL